MYADKGRPRLYKTTVIVASLRQKAAAKLEARRTRAVADEPRMTLCSSSGSYIHGENSGAALAAATHKPIANTYRKYSKRTE